MQRYVSPRDTESHLKSRVLSASFFYLFGFFGSSFDELSVFEENIFSDKLRMLFKVFFRTRDFAGVGIQSSHMNFLGCAGLFLFGIPFVVVGNDVSSALSIGLIEFPLS